MTNDSLWYPNATDLLVIYAEHIGDPAALTDPAGFEAALASPWQSAFGEDAYPTIHLKAAALYVGVERRQAFMDGNKRIAFYGTRLLYAFAEYEFDPPEGDFYDLAMDIAVMHPIDIPLVAERFAEWALPIPDTPDY